MMRTRTDWIAIAVVAAGLAVMAVVEFVDIGWFENELANEMFGDAIARLIGGAIFVIVLLLFGYRGLFRFPGVTWTAVLIMVPGVLVAINNFPISAFVNGRTELVEPSWTIWVFVLECLSVGFFEELVFRGLVLIVLLQRLPQTKTGLFQAIVLSSVLFGFVHLLNLFQGAALWPTLQQVGYSSLMGALWAVVFVATRNIYYAMGLHALYNFFGLVLFRLGSVTDRYDTVTIVSTIVVGILAAAYYLWRLDHVKPKDVQALATHAIKH